MNASKEPTHGLHREKQMPLFHREIFGESSPGPKEGAPRYETHVEPDMEAGSSALSYHGSPDEPEAASGSSYSRLLDALTIHDVIPECRAAPPLGPPTASSALSLGLTARPHNALLPGSPKILSGLYRQVEMPNRRSAVPGGETPGSR